MISTKGEIENIMLLYKKKIRYISINWVKYVDIHNHNSLMSKDNTPSLFSVQLISFQFHSFYITYFRYKF